MGRLYPYSLEPELHRTELKGACLMSNDFHKNNQMSNDFDSKTDTSPGQDRESLNYSQLNKRSSPPSPKADIGEANFIYYNPTQRHRTFPELPDFGILYINLPRAAHLIAVDLWFSGRYVVKGMPDVVAFETIEDPAIVSALSDLTKTFEKRLLRSIQEGQLPSVQRKRDFADFVDAFDEDYIPGETYIHYNDLRKWLVDKGYVGPEGLDGIGAALDEFEEDELAVAAQITHDVSVRRLLRRYERNSSTSIARALEPEYVANAELVRTREALSDALKRVDQLEGELKHAHLPRQSAVDRPLFLKERRTLLVIIAALCKALGIEWQGRNAGR